MRYLLAGALLLAASLGQAVERDVDGYFHTGQAVRTKKIVFGKVNVYAIDHAMKELPADKSKHGVIEADVDKKLEWKMLRHVEAAKIHKALRDAYAMNGYTDSAKIGKFVGALSGLKKGDWVTISYDAAAKTTTLYAPNGAIAQVPGEDFMRATWSIWFGHIDQPDLPDSLVSKLK